jgi:nicotinamidase-related amidase
MSNQSSKQYEMQGQYTPENSALVLIDHQVGTLTFVHNMSSDDSLRNAVMLAKAAKAYGMPVVLTTSQEDHVQGPTAPAYRDSECMGRSEFQCCSPRYRAQEAHYGCSHN